MDQSKNTKKSFMNQPNGVLGFWGSLLLILKGYRVPVQQSNAYKFQASLPNSTSGNSSPYTVEEIMRAAKEIRSLAKKTTGDVDCADTKFRVHKDKLSKSIKKTKEVLNDSV